MRALQWMGSAEIAGTGCLWVCGLHQQSLRAPPARARLAADAVRRDPGLWM